MRRLSYSLLPEPARFVRQPQYDRERLEIGLAHIGVGAFHRCHGADFVDDMREACFACGHACGYLKERLGDE
jgi:fructuronate reductase